MKTNNPLHRLTALLLVLLLATACTRDDDFAPSSADDDATPAALTISVTDGGYAPADAAPGTRAVERGYGTEFTAGDKIGFYAVEVADASNPDSDRKFLHENVCLTHDGTTWTLPAGTDLTHCPPTGGKVFYFAYYPYQGDITGLVDIDMRNADGINTFETRRFFQSLVGHWFPAFDQSTYEAYTANDLMTAEGKVTTRTDGKDGFVLSFEMEHRMSLVVMHFPIVKCTYTDNSSGVEQEKSYNLYSDAPKYFLKENHHTGRYLINPIPVVETIIEGTYYSTSGEHRYSFIIKNISTGIYKRFTVDGGGEKVEPRPLRAGDFYMNDGTIVPQECVPGNMPQDVKKDCIGIVFTTFDQTLNAPLLRRHHPECNHGTVIALRDAHHGTVWSNRDDITVNDWTNSDDRGEDKVDIGITTGLGYANTYALRLYNKTHAADFEIAAVAEIDRYGERTPAPANSSGWYLPDMEMGTSSTHLAIEASFQKAGGETLDMYQYYWTSVERGYAYVIGINTQGGRVDAWKTDTYPVRAMLAF